MFVPAMRLGAPVMKTMKTISAQQRRTLSWHASQFRSMTAAVKKEMI
jgi:hypothetical protein